MNADTAILRQLARPVAEADRRRVRLVSTGVAGTGVFLLAALAIITVGTQGDGTVEYGDGSVQFFQTSTLAPYLAQSGLRGGTATGALLLAIPFVIFGLQALRTGTAARERRLAALSLAGATRPQLRRVALLEGTRAAALGALWAGPAYLLTWLVFGVIAPDGWKMLPRPTLALALAWPALILVLALAGGLTARAATRAATVSPLGMTRRVPRPLTIADAVIPVLVISLVLLCLSVSFALSGTYTYLWLGVVFVGLLLLALTGGRWLVLFTGRIAVRGGLLTSMAGRRLLADVRSPGRVAGVLFTVGFAFGVIAAQVAQLLTPLGPNQGYGDGIGFYLGGFAAATLGGLVACVVASSSLVVGAIEQVLDSRRATAVLVALAASPRFVSAMIRRQLLLAAVPGAVLGTPLGWLAGSAIGAGNGWTWQSLLALAVAMGMSALASALGALAAARAVRPAVLASSTPENLRAP